MLSGNQPHHSCAKHPHFGGLFMLCHQGWSWHQHLFTKNDCRSNLYFINVTSKLLEQKIWHTKHVMSFLSVT